MNTVLKVISEPPPSPRDFRPEIPHKLERICLKCLAKEPADRYPTALALAEQLQRFHATHAQKSASSSKATSQPSALLVARDTGKRIRLFREATVIGRAADCDIILRVADISKRHCRILVQGDRASVEDLGSANGTQVNGQRVKRAALHEGDVLDLAGHVFEFRCPKPGQ